MQSINRIILRITICIILVGLWLSAVNVQGQYQTVSLYYSENLRSGQVYRWNVTHFEINETIWELDYTDFQLGSNITIELTSDEIGQTDYFNYTALSPIEDIDHSALMDIKIDDLPMPLDRFDNDYLLMNIEILAYGWVGETGFTYYPSISFLTTVHRHLDDNSIVDSLPWLWYISNYTIDGREVTIYYDRDGTKVGKSYEERQIWKYNLDFGVFTEFSDNYTITAPADVAGAKFGYKFELVSELPEMPTPTTNPPVSSTSQSSVSSTSSITSTPSNTSTTSTVQSVTFSTSESKSLDPNLDINSNTENSTFLIRSFLIAIGVLISYTKSSGTHK